MKEELSVSRLVDAQVVMATSLETRSAKRTRDEKRIKTDLIGPLVASLI